MDIIEKELARRERSKPEKTKEEDYEEIITELKTKVTVMEEQADKNENKAHDWETDYKQVKEYNDVSHTGELNSSQHYCRH